MHPHIKPNALVDLYLTKFKSFLLPDEVISWINMPIYEALKRQLAIEINKKNKDK